MLKKDRAVVLLHTPSRVLRDTQTTAEYARFCLHI